MWNFLSCYSRRKPATCLEADYKKKYGGHYIMIKKAGQKFRCYNVTENVPAKAEDYNSIDAVMKKDRCKI